MVLLLLFSSVTIAQNNTNSQKTEYTPSSHPTKVLTPKRFFVSQPVRDLPSNKDVSIFEGKIVPKHGAETSKELSAKRQRKLAYLNSAGKSPTAIDPLAQGNKEPLHTPEHRAPITTFEGIGLNVSPPDPSMAVGPNHIVTMENGLWAVYDKSGTLAPGFPRNLTDPLQAPGSTQNAGDPVVMYDREADRWFISQFQLPSNDVFLIGVSTTPDPTGSYNVYEYELGAGNDYPHYGVWGDSYVTAGNFTGAQKVYTFNRQKMLDGDASAEIVGFSPSDFESAPFSFAAPIPVHSEAAGAATGPIKIVFYQDDAFPGVATNNDHIGLWNIEMDWTNASTIAASTISGKNEIPTAPFDAAIAGGFSNIAQPGTGQRIDAIVGAIMNMSHWYKFPTHESILLNWVVEVTDGTQISGIRWVELRSTDGGSSWSVYQEGTFTDPTGSESVFMGCISMDMQGNIGLGYTKSGTSTFPSLYYTGRMNGDLPLGEMTVAESLAFTGTNSVTGNDRYGDYGQGVRDPSDDLTFWVTSEYSGDGGANGRQVGIYSFRIGAEFTNDVAVTEITSPNTGEGLSASETVTITVANFGSATQTNIPVQFAVNGGTPVTEVIPGPIAFGETVSYSFSTTIDLSTIDTYTICATTQLGSDELSSNDQLCKDVMNLISVCIPTTTGGCNIDGIKRLILGTINVDDGGNTCNTESASGNEGYADRRNLSTDLDRATGLNSHILQAQSNFDPANFPGLTEFDVLSAWVDFNDNGIFEAGEQLIDGVSFTSAGELNNFTLTIPTSANLGSHILRLKAFDPNSANDSTNPCEDLEFGETQDYTVNIIDTSLTCLSTSTFNGPSGWDNGIPDNTTAAIIAADYDTSIFGNIIACELTVNSGFTLTVTSGHYASVENDITIDGTLLVQHEGSIVQVEEDAITTNNGSITIQKTTPTIDVRNYISMSSPMSAETRDGVYGASRAVFGVIPSNFVPFSIDFGTFPEFMDAEIFLDDNNDFLLPYVGSTALPTAGIGMLVFPQPNASVGPDTYDFDYTQGTLNSGTISIPINYNGPATTNNYNLLGNPYASAIDVPAFLAANDAVNEVYYWEHITNPVADLPGPGTSNFSMNDISMRNAMMGVAAVNGGTAPGEYMASGQGFGIKADQAEMASNTPVVFTNSIRVVDNNDDLRTQTISDINKIWLSMTSTSYERSVQTAIGFTPNATSGYDKGYDSKRLATSISLFSNLNGEYLSIQGREVFNDRMEIALGFSTTIDREESYTISIDRLDGEQIENSAVYLIDNTLNTITDLKEGDYAFTANKGIQPDRFTLIFRESGLLNTDENITTVGNIYLYPNPTSHQVIISYAGDKLLREARILDIQGKVIMTIDLNNFDNSQQIDLSKLASGTYFVQITSNTDTIVKKLILK